MFTDVNDLSKYVIDPPNGSTFAGNPFKVHITTPCSDPPVTIQWVDFQGRTDTANCYDGTKKRTTGEITRYVSSSSNHNGWTTVALLLHKSIKTPKLIKFYSNIETTGKHFFILKGDAKN